MEFPEDIRYTKDHEWVRLEGDSATVGISAFAQDELGEIVYVDVPAAGKSVSQGGVLCVVESTKAASDVYSPIGGTVLEGNALLGSEPSLVNSDPYGRGWLVKLSNIDKAQVESLLSAAGYQAILKK